jgi:hypothetical protein
MLFLYRKKVTSLDKKSGGTPATKKTTKSGWDAGGRLNLLVSGRGMAAGYAGLVLNQWAGYGGGFQLKRYSIL